MGRSAFHRTVVEKAPSHDNKPCYAAWVVVDFDRAAPEPTDRRRRPRWSLQFYDTTPLASDPEHIRRLTQHIEESTRSRRDRTGRGARDRVEVHGLPLPVDSSTTERVVACAMHHQAEAAARSGTEFNMRPRIGDFTMDHEIIVIDGPGLEPDDSDGWAQSDKNKSPFMAVSFNEGLADFIANNIDHDWDNVRLRRVASAELAEAMAGMRESIEWYYDSLSSETKDDEDYVFGAC